MRIAIDARYLNETHSGIARYSENLLTHLSKIDQENEYVVFLHPKFNRRLRIGENFTTVPVQARPVSMRTLTTFGQRVRHAKCDFLHSLAPIAPLYGIERKILTVHDLQPYVIKEYFHGIKPPPQSRLGSLFFRATFPHFMRSATWLITVSHATKDRLAQIFPETEHKTIAVHSGVENSYFASPEDSVAQLVSKKLELPPEFVLYVGSAQPNKNLPAMIRAFDRCRREHPDALGGHKFIMVVGRDPYFAECRRLIRSLGLEKDVRGIGPITEEEKRILYARARVLFFVTRGEGFGLPIVEAQASGLPVLAGDDAAAPEITAGSALLADTLDEDDITAKLSEILLDASLRRRLSEAGEENVKRFSWQRTAERVLEIYSLLMA